MRPRCAATPARAVSRCGRKRHSAAWWFSLSGPLYIARTEARMEPHGLQRNIEGAPRATRLKRVLGFMSVATMLMTIPQVLTIWLRHEAAGVSVISWSAYFVSAALWFWYGLER